MKRIIALGLALSVLAVLSAGCKKTENESAERVITAEDYSYALTEGGYIRDFTALDVVELPDWSEYSLDRSKVEPAESVIDGAINTLKSYFGTVEITDRAVEDGDTVNMDYEGKLDGVAFEGGSASGATLTAGSEQFVDHFLTKIIGHMPGETFDLEITFPDPYQNNPDLSGKLTVFTVTINYISGSVELTDEFIKEHAEKIESYTGFEGLETGDELRERFRKYYYEYNQKNEIYTLLSEMEVEIPDVVYDYVYHATDLSVYNSYGKSIEEMAKDSGLTDEELRDYVEADSRPEIYYQAIAESEGWEITESDYEEVTHTADNEAHIERYGKGYLARYVLMGRALRYLMERIPVL